MSTIYRASQNATTDTKVWVLRDGRLGRLAPVRWEPRRGRALVRGDAGGFAYGYGGAGPRNLAAAILADALGLGALNRRDDRAALIQGFKWEVVARVPQDAPLAIARADVLAFVARWDALIAEQDLAAARAGAS